MRGKRNAGLLLGVAITLGCVAWAIANYDFTSVWEALSRANYWWVILALFSQIALIYIRVVRWRYFLEPIKKVSMYNAAMAACVGFLVNMVIPARAGEFARAWLLGQREAIRTSAALGTVVIERVFDGLSIVVIIVITLALTDVPPDKQDYWQILKMTGYMFSAVFVTLCALAYSMHKRVKFVEWLIDSLLGVLPRKIGERARHILDSFRRGFEFFDSSRHLMMVAVLSVLFWVIAGSFNVAFLFAFGLQDLPALAAYLILIAQVIGVMAPAPGFVGPYHAATMAALAFYGVGAETGLSIALVMHAVMFLINIAPGVVFLWLERISISDVSQSG